MLVEEQIHRHYVELEEQRCRMREAEYEKTPKTKGKKAQRRKIPKPWVRPGPYALCQDLEFLMLVKEYDYNLADESFQQYCASRGVLHVAGKVGSRTWLFFSEYRKTQEEFMADSTLDSAEDQGGKGNKYTAKGMESQWQIILLGRATLQDAWELYAVERNGPQPKLAKT